jgi:hypothetical protein
LGKHSLYLFSFNAKEIGGMGVALKHCADWGRYKENELAIPQPYWIYGEDEDMRNLTQ